MAEYNGLTFKTLTEADIPALTPIMKRAFDDDSCLYHKNPVGGPEGYDDGSFLKKWGIDSQSEAWRIDFQGKPVGAMILFIHPTAHEGWLGNIFIDPDCMGRGFGHTAWQFAETSHPDVKAWGLETPAVSFRNHCFYVNKCGFHIVEVEGRDRYEAQFRLRKTM